MYLTLKHLHLIFVALSLLAFLVRGISLFMNSAVLGKTWVKILPQVINTILLVSGIVLAMHLHMSPGNQPWLMAKIIGLVVYIGLGIVAFRVANSSARKLLWLSALIAFAYIVSVAIRKSPMGFFG